MRYLLFSIVFILNIAVVHATTVEQIRVSQNDRVTRLVLDMEKSANFKSFKLENPHRLVIDVENGKTNSKLTVPSLAGTPINNIRQGQHDPNTLRLVLDLKHAVDFELQKLGPNENYPQRLVIDLGNNLTTAKREDAPKAKEETTPPPPNFAPPQAQRTPDHQQITPPLTVRNSPALPRRDIVVAIDPGHGGRDPGAIGPGGTREKDVVLQISRRLANLVNAEPGMRAVMTRDSDVFVTLRQRIQRAKAAGADMFISIHADAINHPNARGSSVYVLSERGASSEAAQILADRENAADLAGGITLDDKDDLLASVLLDLSQTASLEASLEVGESVLSGLKRVGNVHKKSVESAAFVVLKSPDIPSVLVETAFISNPQEEQNLRNAQHQQKLAQAMMAGIRTYFQRNPITQQVRPQQHIVNSGDTLSTIAQRYQVNMSELKSTNNLQTTRLQVGDVLRIP